MPNLHDIDKRIKSISSTKQITRTMEMVAGAKVKHATERIFAATPYSESMTEMLQGVAERVQASENPLLEKRENVKRILAVAVVSDRGLAGGFNSNVLRTIEKTIRAKKAQGVEVDAAGEGRFEGVDAGVGFGREGEDVAGVGAVAGEAGIDGTEGGAEGGGVEGVGLVEEDEELLVAAEGEEAGAEAVVLRGGL